MTAPRVLPPDIASRIDQYRESRIAHIDRVLHNLPTDSLVPWDRHAATDLPLRYALVHHIFAAVSRAAETGDLEAIRASMTLREDQSPLKIVSLATGPVILAHPSNELLTHDTTLAEAPVALVSAEVCTTPSTDDRSLVASALCTAAEAGFHSIVARNCRIVVLIAERRPTDQDIRSWTTTALPATIHLDYFAEHYYVARDLIHEAAHTELNDIFSAFGQEFPDDATFYAPWLDMYRPAFGFLHGTWAFSHVALFCKWLDQSDAPSPVAALGRALFTKYAEHMYAARADFNRAIKILSDDTVADLITEIRDEVLSGLPEE